MICLFAYWVVITTTVEFTETILISLSVLMQVGLGFLYLMFAKLVVSVVSLVTHSLALLASLAFLASLGFFAD